MGEIKKILYPHTWDPSDPNAWSGTTKWLMDSLSARGIIVVPAILRRSLLPRIRNKVSEKLTGKRHLSSHSKMEAKALGKQVDELARTHKPDLILSTSSLPLGEVTWAGPKAFLTDATIHLLSQYYDNAGNLSEASQKEADEVEGKAIKNCDAVFYPSEWAKESAVNHYGGNPSNIHVLPLGANLPFRPEASDIFKAIEGRSPTDFRFLFIGKEWDRKGGDKAIAIIAALRKRGVSATLELMGAQPPEGQPLPDFVVSHGFINKASEQGQRRFTEILSNAHFMLLPTLAECAGLVFAEASAFGLPSITHSVHGVPGMVTHQRNGLMLPLAATPDDFAEMVLPYCQNFEQYKSLSRSARDMFDADLNWEAISGKMLEILNLAAQAKKSEAR